MTWGRAGADGTSRLMRGLVWVPDVSFFRFELSIRIERPCGEGEIHEQRFEIVS